MKSRLPPCLEERRDRDWGALSAGTPFCQAPPSRRGPRNFHHREHRGHGDGGRGGRVPDLGSETLLPFRPLRWWDHESSQDAKMKFLEQSRPGRNNREPAPRSEPFSFRLCTTRMRFLRGTRRSSGADFVAVALVVAVVVVVVGKCPATATSTTTTYCARRAPDLLGCGRSPLCVLCVLCGEKSAQRRPMAASTACGSTRRRKRTTRASRGSSPSPHMRSSSTQRIKFLMSACRSSASLRST
jgi:hypothetical protein